MMTYAIYSLIILGAFTALGRKWDFRGRTVALWVVFMLAGGGGVMYGMSSVWPALEDWMLLTVVTALALGTTLATIMFFFFRDPPRTPPAEKRVVVSPADGRIVYVQTVTDGDFPFALKRRRKIPMQEFTCDEFPAKAFVQIGIEMTYLDVHINRAPISGEIIRLLHIPGKFRSLRLTEALLENERVFTLIQGPDMVIGVLQIASRMVRRIIPFVKSGDEVMIGQRIGTIRFGSQVDLLVPLSESLRIRVSKGDLARAGESVLAQY